MVFGLGDKAKANLLTISIVIFLAIVIFTSINYVSAVETLTDSQLLDKTEALSAKYFYEKAMTNGLVLDASNVDFSSIAATGFGLSAFTIMAERYNQTADWSYSPEQLRARTNLILDTLTTLQNAQPNTDYGKEGLFYHFIASNGKRQGASEVSTADNALLFAGIITAGEYFGGEIKTKGDAILAKANWSYYLKTPANNFPSNNGINYQFSHGWNNGYILSQTWDRPTDEVILISVIALASNPENIDFQKSLFSWPRAERSYSGYNVVNSYFGSLFTYEYAHAWIDFKAIGRDKPVNGTSVSSIDWWQNSINAVKAARQFAIDNSGTYSSYGADSWGISAVQKPNGNYFGDYGSNPCEANSGNGVHDGTIAVYSSVSTMPFFKDEDSGNLSMNLGFRTLRKYYDNYSSQLWGQYAFKDSFNSLGQFSSVYLGLDKGPEVMMIENYRTGFMWNQFMKNTQVKAALKKVFECPNGVCGTSAYVCSQNSDCGTNRAIGSAFCSSNNVAQNYITYTCNNPATAQASCSNSTSLQTIQTCTNGCLNGVCNSPVNNSNCTVPTNGMIISKNTTLCNGVYYVPEGMSLGSNYITLDCNGATLIGNKSNGKNGITVSQKKYCLVKNCIVKNFSFGFYTWDSYGDSYINNSVEGSGFEFDNGGNYRVINNRISNGAYGVDFFWYSSGNVVDSNVLENITYTGISFSWGVTNSVMKNNIVKNSNMGVASGCPYGDKPAHYNNYTNNIVTNSMYGIYVCRSRGNYISGNTVKNNSYGFYVYNSVDNGSIIYNNNVIDNNVQVGVTGNNTWNNGNKGNYWSNYDSVSEGCVDSNSDGVCDNGYTIATNNKDNYPLVNQYVYVPVIKCSQNSQCGTSGVVGGQFCSSNNVAQNYINYTCNNAGTEQSSCSNSTTVQTLQTCSFGCSNATCDAPPKTCKDTVPGMVITNDTILCYGGSAVNITFSRDNLTLDCNGSYLYANRDIVFKIVGRKGITLNNCNVYSTSGTPMMISSSSNIVINNFIIHGQTGMWIDRSNNVLIFGTNIQPDSYSGIGMQVQYSNKIDVVNSTIANMNNPIYYIFTSNSTFENNTIGGSWDAGLTLDGSNYNVIRGNLIAGNQYQPGIQLYNSSFNTIVKNKVIRNSYRGTWGHASGIYLASSKNNLISENNISQNDDKGIYISGQANNNVITNNVIENNRDGIVISSSINNSVISNIIKNNTYVYGNITYGNGLQTYYGDNTTIMSNVITSHIMGIDSTGGTNLVITGNNITNSNVTGVKLHWTIKSTIKDNYITQNPLGIELLWADYNNIYNNYFNNLVNLNQTAGYYLNYFNTTKKAGTNIIGNAYIGGNYWSDYTGEDTNGDGLGERNYSIGTSYGSDFLPLTTPQTVIINCTMNTDCGIDGLYQDNYCSYGPDGVLVEKTYVHYTCENPGTSDSVCRARYPIYTNDTCHYGCENGACIIPPIACVNDVDCGLPSKIGDNFCSIDNNVFSRINIPYCNNPGTPESKCENATPVILNQTCTNGCTNGTCNAPPVINCYNNTGCGLPRIIKDNYCTSDGGAVVRDIEMPVCTNPGTPQSKCELVYPRLTNDTCIDGCSNGKCIRNIPPVNLWTFNNFVNKYKVFGTVTCNVATINQCPVELGWQGNKEYFMFKLTGKENLTESLKFRFNANVFKKSTVYIYAGPTNAQKFVKAINVSKSGIYEVEIPKNAFLVGNAYNNYILIWLTDVKVGYGQPTQGFSLGEVSLETNPMRTYVKPTLNCTGIINKTGAFYWNNGEYAMTNAYLQISRTGYAGVWNIKTTTNKIPISTYYSTLLAWQKASPSKTVFARIVVTDPLKGAWTTDKCEFTIK